MPYIRRTYITNAAILFMILVIPGISLAFGGGPEKRLPDGIHEIDKRTVFSIGVFGMAEKSNYFYGLGISDKEIAELNFDKGDGLNYSGGLMAEVCFDFTFSIQIRASLNNLSGKLKSDYYLPIMNDQYAKTEHELKTELFYVSSDLLLKYIPFCGFYLMGGGSFSVPIISYYQHTVKIASDMIEYSDHSVSRTFNKIKIEKPEKRISVKGGIGYSIPLIEESLYLTPEINIEIPMNNILKNTKSKVYNYSGVMGLVFEL
jgi:hypothetical protein